MQRLPGFISVFTVLFFIFSLTGNIITADRVFTSVAFAQSKADGKIKLEKKLQKKRKKDDDKDKDNDNNGIPGKIRKLQNQINALQIELDNIQLTAGQQGDPGPQGPVGPAGPQGDTGATGPQGLAGADGQDGAEGPQGPVGPVGLQGPQGDPGPQGPVGPAGPQGLAGADGQDGAEGPQGPVGPAGPQGDTGATGPQGPAGADGLDGAEGPQGPVGPVGLQGPQGDLGPQGLPGPGGARLTYVSEKPNLIFIPPANTGNFVDIPQRVLDYTKHSGTSILRITYHDFFFTRGFQSTTILNIQFMLKDLASGTEIILPNEPVFIERMVQHLSGSSFTTETGGPRTFHFILDPALLGANASFLTSGNYSLRVQSLEDNFNGNFQSTSIGNFEVPFLIQVEEIEP